MTMKTIRFVLTIILTIYSIPTFLSGLDIFKGKEPDLSTEWIILCIFFFLSIVLFITSLFEILNKDKKTITWENIDS